MDKSFGLPRHVTRRKAAALTVGKGSVAEAMALGDTERIAEMERAE
jgi:hypothetical protein